MIGHPLLFSVLLTDLIGLVFLLAAAASAMQVVAGWQRGSASSGQLRLERRAEAASILARGGVLLFLFSTLALVAAIAAVLPKMVPGAMCGTGVIEATGDAAGRALALRCLAVALLCAWHLLDRLDRRSPESPLTAGAARSLLLATPVALVSAWGTWNTLLRVDAHRPVDCCAAVYDRLGSLAEATGAGGIPDICWVWGLLAISAVLVLLALRVGLGASAGHGKAAAALAATTACWVAVAWMSLVSVLSAYHYGVLEHACPWCLFLPEHHLVGFALFGFLAMAALEGPAAWLSSRVASRFPVLETAATRRVRRAGWRVLVAVFLFLLLAGLPAVVWRVRFGVWMG